MLMPCASCGRLDCSCGQASPFDGPQPKKYGPGWVEQRDPFAHTPPKTTSGNPRLDVQPFNNSPKQPPLESK